MAQIPEQPSAEWEEAERAPELTYREVGMRNLFVNEYLVDYDAYAAACRCGYSPAFAKEYAVKFMNEAYVLKKISELEVKPNEITTEEMKLKVMSGLLREANFRGAGSSPSARVAALAKICAIYGLDAPTRSKTELTGADGQALNAGTFVIPGLMTPEQWEEAAKIQQAALTTDDHAKNNSVLPPPSIS